MEGWSKGQNRHRVGLFPSSYVEPLAISTLDDIKTLVGVAFMSSSSSHSLMNTSRLVAITHCLLLSSISLYRYVICFAVDRHCHAGRCRRASWRPSVQERGQAACDWQKRGRFLASGLERCCGGHSAQVREATAQATRQRQEGTPTTTKTQGEPHLVCMEIYK